MKQTATGDFGLRVTRWIRVLPVVVAAVCAVPLADSMVSWVITWVYLFLPQFLVLGVVIAEKISVPGLIGAAIAAGLLAVLLCLGAQVWLAWTPLIYLFVMPAVFASAWAAVWIDRHSESRDVPRAIASASSILPVSGLGYLVWMIQVT